MTKYNWASIIKWNPDAPKEEMTVEINPEEVAKMSAAFLKTEHFAIYKEIEKNLGSYTNVSDFLRGDVTKTYSRMGAINTLLLAYGEMTEEEYLALLTADWKAEKFPYGCGAGEDFIEKTKRVTRMIWAEQGSAPNVTPLTKVTLPSLEDNFLTAMNTMLTSVGAPSYDEVKAFIDGIDSNVEHALTRAAQLEQEKTNLLDEVEKIKEVVADLTSKAMVSVSSSIVEGGGSIPDGKVTTKKASTIFPGVTLTKDFDVPVWEWDGVHPDVPQVDNNYIFRPAELLRIIYALVTNQRAYLHGHTGTGKTTLIEQVAARLQWPFVRINFDSEITRMDLIGRDTLTTDGTGKTVSKFVDGILPTVLSGPYIACFDELDFVRPDVAYVMQSALEGNQLRITEDGDRIVRPHQFFRMFGTGNTVGQGDEHGMYAGARPQSLAFLDRFTIWLKVDYLPEADREQLVKHHYPSLTAAQLNLICKYTTEHIEAFTGGKLIQPLSPRGMLAIAKATVLIGDIRTAIEMTTLDRASNDDRSTLRGIIDRVVK